MKKIILVLIASIVLLLTSCERRGFYVNKPGLNLSYGICEAIDYPSNKAKIKDDSSFNVNVMIANLYYGKKYDGSTGLFIGTEEKPGYNFETIIVSLNDFENRSIFDYSVDINEYSKQENGIEDGKFIIRKKDFNLIYSFNLIILIPEEYDNNITFKVTYNEKTQQDQYSFSRCFSFHLLKTEEYIFLENFDFSFGS